MIVYKIINEINNKLYFGITKCSLKKRWNEHKSKSKSGKTHLAKSMLKYGIENFKIEVIKHCISLDEMYCLEIELIKKHKTNNPIFGYNNSIGGEVSSKGKKLSSETKNKISNYQKTRIRKPHSQETKKAIGIANSNKTRSEELKKRWSNSRKGCEAQNKKKVILNNELIFNSLTEASLKTGVSITSIANNLKGLSKLTKKGKWEYY